MKFDFLINIIFSHEYYNECIPSEIFEIEPRRTNRVVLGGPKYPFRQTGRNQYALIGDREELLDHLSISPDGLNLEFQAHSKDPNFLLYTQSLLPKSRKTKSDGREKRKAIFEAKTKCAQKSRLLPPSGQNTSVVQTPFESCLNDAFLLNFLLKYHLKPIANLAKNRIFT